MPCWGMAATASQRRRTNGARPFSSLPTTRATGPSPSGKVVERLVRLAGQADGPHAERAELLSAAGTPPTTAKGRCSIAPAAVLVTVGDSRAERWRGSTTPLTPAHSALRSSAPRLRGSVIPAATRRNGAVPRRSGAAQVLECDGLERAGQGQDALGRVGAGLGVEPGPGHGLDRDPQPAGQLLDAVELRRGVLILGEQDPAHGAPPDREQLEYGPASLDLVAAELA